MRAVKKGEKRVKYGRVEVYHADQGKGEDLHGTIQGSQGEKRVYRICRARGEGVENQRGSAPL